MGPAEGTQCAVVLLVKVNARPWNKSETKCELSEIYTAPSFDKKVWCMLLNEAEI